MSFILFNIILLSIVFLLFLLLSAVWPPDSPWAPWWTTTKEISRAVCELAKVKKGDVFFELGSGTGTTLLVASKEYGAQAVGIEIDPLRYIFSTLMIRIIRVNNKVIIKRKNFFDEDLSKATVVYVYLVPKTLVRLLPKFKKELKKGTRIVSYVYEADLPSKKFDKQHSLRLYIV